MAPYLPNFGVPTPSPRLKLNAIAYPRQRRDDTFRQGVWRFWVCARTYEYAGTSTPVYTFDGRDHKAQFLFYVREEEPDPQRWVVASASTARVRHLPMRTIYEGGGLRVSDVEGFENYVAVKLGLNMGGPLEFMLAGGLMNPLRQIQLFG